MTATEIVSPYYTVGIDKERYNDIMDTVQCTTFKESGSIRKHITHKYNYTCHDVYKTIVRPYLEYCRKRVTLQKITNRITTTLVALLSS